MTTPGGVIRRLCWLAGAVALLVLAGCAGATPTPAPAAPGAAPDLSPSARQGETRFNANCAVCHGERAAGTQVGPPLVHKIYEPGHHPDFAFRNAVSQGVPAHHWPYGDMAPVPGLSPEDVENIICYVRELQRAAGIAVRGGC